MHRSYRLFLQLGLVVFLGWASAATHVYAQVDRDPGTPAGQVPAEESAAPFVDDRDVPGQAPRRKPPGPVDAVSDQDADQGAPGTGAVSFRWAPAPETLDDGRGDAPSRPALSASFRALPAGDASADRALDDGRGDAPAGLLQARRTATDAGPADVVQVLDDGRDPSVVARPAPGDEATEAVASVEGEPQANPAAEVPAGMTLDQNYPNPFNPQTEITFTVAAEGSAVLTVYDAGGREVKTLYDGFAQPGRAYQTTFDGRDLASGLYVYALVSGGYRLQKTMVLVK